MKRRKFRCAMMFLISFLLAVSVLSAVPDIHAQTTSISNLSYPTAPVPSGGARVTFDVTYSSLSSSKGDVLLAFVFDGATSTYASGSGSSSPDKCLPLGATQLNGKAVCGWFLASSSGTEHLTFDLQFSTHRTTYNLVATAAVATTAGEAIFTSLSEQKFSITAGSKLKLTVDTQSTVPITIDGTPVGVGTASLDVDPGTHSISVPGLVPIDNLTQLRFDHWDDGSNLPTRSVDVESDITIGAIFVTQHKFILVSPVNATGAGWYDDGSTAHFSVPLSRPIEGALGVLGGKLQFKGWYENGKLVTTSNAGTIQMNDAHSLGAEWQADYTLPIAIIGGIIAVIGAALVFSFRRAKSGKRRNRSS